MSKCDSPFKIVLESQKIWRSDRQPVGAPKEARKVSNIKIHFLEAQKADFIYDCIGGVAK